MKTRWTTQQIIRMLRERYARGKDISYNSLARSQQSLLSAAAYHFGSYRKAVARSGINYEDVRRRPRWTKPAIIRLIKGARRRGEDLHWSAVTTRRDELRKAAFAALQPRLFGSWDRALQAAGLDADEISRYRRWTRNTIAAELRDRSRDGELLNSGALQQDDPGMHAAAVRHFGSYDQALREAGLDPVSIRQRRRWTPADVRRELRVFRRKHGRLTDAALRREAPALYGAVLRLFGTLAAARRASARSGKRPAKQ